MQINSKTIRDTMLKLQGQLELLNSLLIQATEEEKKAVEVIDPSKKS